LEIGNNRAIDKLGSKEMRIRWYPRYVELRPILDRPITQVSRGRKDGIGAELTYLVNRTLSLDRSAPRTLFRSRRRR
jgi:hypothetical protein